MSHGQPSDPDVAEAELRVLRDRVASFLRSWTVSSATLAKPGALRTAMQRAGQTPLVYPVFMTDGWFTRTALRDRLAGTAARILPPFGVDPLLPVLAAGWLRQELADRDWSAARTRLIVAAHGSGRSGNAARDTRIFANALQAQMEFAETRIGFIEQEPTLADVLVDAGARSICLPFFAARRDHVLDDLPAAYDQTGFRGLRLPPIGLHRSVPRLIADALVAACAEEVPA